MRDDVSVLWIVLAAACTLTACTEVRDWRSKYDFVSTCVQTEKRVVTLLRAQPVQPSAPVVLEIHRPREFATQLLSSSHPVVVLFYAHDAASCLGSRAVLRALAVKYNGYVFFSEVDLSSSTLAQLEAQYAIDATPTLLLLQQGHEICRIIGDITADNVARSITRMLMLQGK